MLNFHISGSRSRTPTDPQLSTKLQLPVAPILLSAAESPPASKGDLVGESKICTVGTSTDSSNQLKRDSPVPTVPLPESKEDTWVRLFSGDRAAANGGDVSSIIQLQAKFKIFSASLGLNANLAKSSIYYGGVSPETKKQILGYNQGEMPFKYLGIPLASRKLTITQWQRLIDRMVASIRTWTTRKLSYAGRLQPVQTMAFGIQAYWSQLFLMPTKVMKTIEAICRSYVWSGGDVVTKRSLVVWHKVCSPKATGGLDLINIKVWNKNVQFKSYWNLASKQDKLWIKWMHSYYVKGQDIQTMQVPQQACWMTRKLFGARAYLQLISPLISRKGTGIRKIYLQMIGNLSKVA